MIVLILFQFIEPVLGQLFDWQPSGDQSLGAFELACHEVFNHLSIVIIIIAEGELDRDLMEHGYMHRDVEWLFPPGDVDVRPAKFQSGHTTQHAGLHTRGIEDNINAHVVGTGHAFLGDVDLHGIEKVFRQTEFADHIAPLCSRFRDEDTTTHANADALRA